MDPTVPENQFIPKKEESGVNTLFEELGSELDFGDVTKLQKEAENNGKHPLEWTLLGMSIIFKIALVAVFIASIDVSIRNMNSSEILKMFPLCSYYSLGIDNYDNSTTCNTYTEILSMYTGKRETLEQNLGISLAKMVPQKLLIQNALKSHEIQYILSKTTDNRVSIDEMMQKFTEIRTSDPTYKGENIECANFSTNEKWELAVSCSFLGFPISETSDKSFTSRIIALNFLYNLRLPSSGFKIINEPKFLDMQAYSSVDPGIKSTFTTRTTLNLKLKYSTPNWI